MLRRSRRSRKSDDESDGTRLDRRTLLTGAAGAAGVAGVAAAAASPLGQATIAAASPTRGEAARSDVIREAQVGGEPIPAEQVSVVPAGEIVDTNAQAVLEALDARLGAARFVEDLKVAVTRVDDFLGGSNASGSIGELGWSLAGTGSGRAGTNLSEPGTFIIDTAGKVNGGAALFLGTKNLEGHPVLLCEFRLKMSALNDTSNRHSCWFGLHNDQAGAEPTTGLYFRYSATDGKWKAVCANAGARTVVTNSTDAAAVADTSYHRFRITCDGGASFPIARFYVDDVRIATITTNLPTGANRYSAAASILKTYPTASGGTTRSLTIDYFALRYEYPR